MLVCRLTTATTVAALTWVVLAGCGGTEGSNGNARKGGSITIGSPGPPDALDPALGRSRDAREALWLVYTPPLTYRRAEGSSGTELIPGVAEDLPDVSEDGETYRFKIREGLRYSDGTRVRPSDFEHTIQRVLRLGAGARLFAGIEGARDYERGGKDDADISGIETDDRTRQVTIRLDDPDPTFEHKLATSFAGMVPPKTPFRDMTPAPPPGVGAYRIARVKPGREFVMTQVRGFGIPDLPEGNVQRITTRVVESDVRRAQAVIKGQLDSMQGSPPVELLPEIRSKYKDRFSEYPTLSSMYFFLNERAPPFDNERVRKAVNFALDKQAIVRLYAGRLEPSCNLLPVGLKSYKRVDPCPYGDPRLSGDPEKARQLIEDADEDGKEVTVYTDTAGNHRAVARYVAGLLDKIGLEGRLKVIDARRYERVLAKAPHAQMGLRLLAPQLPHPLPFVSALGGNVLDGDFAEDVHEVARDAEPNGSDDRYADIDRTIVEKAYVAPFGSEKVGLFLSERMDAANCARFHRVYGADYASFCLK